MSIHDPITTSIVATLPPVDDILPELVGVDGEGNVVLVHREEAGEVVSSHSWSPGTDAANTVHAMIEWLSRGAPGSFAAFEI